MPALGIERAVVFAMAQRIGEILGDVWALSPLGRLADDFEKSRHHDSGAPSLEIGAMALLPKPVSIFRIGLDVSHRGEQLRMIGEKFAAV